jgi:hypothetical protein
MSLAGYNNNACVVAGIWLMFAIWFVLSEYPYSFPAHFENQDLKPLCAMRPAELQDPMIAFSIFSGVTLTHAGKRMGQKNCIVVKNLAKILPSQRWLRAWILRGHSSWRSFSDSQ